MNAAHEVCYCTVTCSLKANVRILEGQITRFAEVAQLYVENTCAHDVGEAMRIHALRLG